MDHDIFSGRSNYRYQRGKRELESSRQRKAIDRRRKGWADHFLTSPKGRSERILSRLCLATANIWSLRNYAISLVRILDMCIHTVPFLVSHFLFDLCCLFLFLRHNLFILPKNLWYVSICYDKLCLSTWLLLAKVLWASGLQKAFSI